VLLVPALYRSKRPLPGIVDAICNRKDGRGADLDGARHLRPVSANQKRSVMVASGPMKAGAANYRPGNRSKPVQGV
jgi:hypothetical protein